ncbi:hypothetical protein FRC04_007913 [Tulasnella sp. 424]|nr:hypothetical protein FRC04_007913 [Tulasnella sp. 424]
MTAQATHIASHLMDTEYSNAAKSLLQDATRLQARNAAVPGASLGELLSSLKMAQGKDSPPFALFLVSGGGRSGNHPRYSGKQQRSSPQAVQNSRKRTRKDVASDGSGGMEAGGVNKAEELAWIMRLIADHGKKTGHRCKAGRTLEQQNVNTGTAGAGRGNFQGHPR